VQKLSTEATSISRKATGNFQISLFRVDLAIERLADMESVFDANALEKVSASFTINATAPIPLAIYLAVARRDGVTPRKSLVRFGTRP